MGRKLNSLLLFFVLVLLSGCFANVGQDLSAITNPTEADTGPKNLTLSNFSISNKSYSGFEVSFDAIGDSNENSDVKIYVCSIKAQAGCDPTLGSSVSLSKSNSKFTASIVLTNLGLSSGDVVKYKIVGSDADGYTGDETEGFLIIPQNSSQVKLINQLGYISMGKANEAGGTETVTSTVVDATGKIYFAGYTSGSFGEANGGSTNAFVARLLPTGELDPSFNYTGIKQLGKVSIGDQANSGEIVNAMSLDASGNIYLAGYTYGSFGEVRAGVGLKTDAFVVKIHPTGALDKSFNSTGVLQLGSVTLGSDADNNEVVYDMSLDLSGNVYITGITTGSLGEINAGSLDVFVAKILPTGSLDTSFNSSGIKQLGNLSIGTNASGEDYATAIKVDVSGNVYIAGRTFWRLGEVGAGGFDAFVAKLLPNGDLDTSFNSTGIKQLGSVAVGAPASGHEYVEEMELDSSGNIFLAGYTTGSFGETKSGTSNDAYIVKILPTGSLDTSFNGSGIKQFGNVTMGAGASGDDRIYAVEINTSGDIFLAGKTTGSLGELANSGNNAFVIKLLANGSLDTSFNASGIKQLGSVSLGTLSTGSESLSAMDLDSQGNIYLVGNTTRDLDETLAGGEDAFVAKILSNGSLDTSFSTNGVKQFGKLSIGSGAGGSEIVNAMTVDSNGNIYLTGMTYSSLDEPISGSLNSDAFVVKYLPSGVLDTSFNGTGIKQLGSLSLGASASGGEYGSAISVDTSGNIFLAGATRGSLAEVNNGSFSYDIFVAKILPSGILDTSFNSIGVKQLGSVSVGPGAIGNEFPKAIALDSDGSIYIAGQTTGSFGEAIAGTADAIVVKLLSTGNLDTSFNSTGIKQLGNSSVGVAANGIEFISSMSLDVLGNIYIAGKTTGSLGDTNGGSNDGFLAKLLPDGSLDTSFNGSGLRQFGSSGFSGSAGDDSFNAIQVDSSGNIFLAGNTGGAFGETNAGSGDGFVVKLLSTGLLDTSFNTTGIKHLGSVTLGVNANGDDLVTSLNIDTSGNIYIAGTTAGDLGETNAGGTDGFLAKILPNGNMDTSFNSTGIKQFGSNSVGSGASANDYIIGVVPNLVSGKLYLGGYTRGSLGELNPGSNNAILIIMDP